MAVNLLLNLSLDSLFYRAIPISLYNLRPHCSANTLIEAHQQDDGHNDPVEIFQ